MTDPVAREPSGRGGLSGFIQRRPRLVFWTTLLVALFVGIALGAGGASQQEELDAQKQRNAALKADLRDATERAETAEKKGREQIAALAALRRRVKRLTLKAEVPGFVGDDVSEVTSSQVVSELNWKVRTLKRVDGSASPGTVLAQTPAEGTGLKAGRTLTVTVARKPPPKPPQWVTIKSFSGDSSTKTDEFDVPDGVKARLVYSMPSDTNNAITLYRAPREYIDLLLNEIGPRSGSTRLYESGRFYLEVEGTYSIQIQVFKRP